MRLTKNMREEILRKATAGVPVVNYKAKLQPVLQAVVCKHMPEPARLAYEDEESRLFLTTVHLEVKEGNGYNGRSMTFSKYDNDPVRGYAVQGRLVVRVDDASFDQARKGTLSYDLAAVVRKTGYLDKHYEQLVVMQNVRKRLKATLESVTTVKRLYDVLEPELHHLIPKEENAAVANLPAAAGPVVDDLRKLGAQFPDVPKVAK